MGQGRPADPHGISQGDTNDELEKRIAGGGALNQGEMGAKFMDQKFEAGNLFALIQDVQAIIEKRCHRFLSNRHGLTWPQYRLLMAAASGQASTLGELAEDVHCSRGNLTGVTDRLQRDGWLTRERHRDDRRVVTLRLTAKGERIRAIHSELLADLAAFANVWTVEERTVLTALLGRFAAAGAQFAQAG